MMQKVERLQEDQQSLGIILFTYLQLYLNAIQGLMEV